jgi:SAM-dependent methyltransferase
MSELEEEVRAADLLWLAPSQSVKTFGKEMVLAARGLPILDVACGTGRNSAWISQLGGQVVGVDINLRQIESARDYAKNTSLAQAFGRIDLLELDLIRSIWPYPPSSVGGIVNIHFLHRPLLMEFSRSLVSGGLLVLETVEARGGNYLQLPEAGLLRATLAEFFSFLVYKERPVGPEGVNAVTVRLVGRRH